VSDSSDSDSDPPRRRRLASPSVTERRTSRVDSFNTRVDRSLAVRQEYVASSNPGLSVVRTCLFLSGTRDRPPARV